MDTEFGRFEVITKHLIYLNEDCVRTFAGFTEEEALRQAFGGIKCCEEFIITEGQFKSSISGITGIVRRIS